LLPPPPLKNNKRIASLNIFFCPVIVFSLTLCPCLSRPALGPTQPPMQRVPCLSRGKAARAWHWPPTPSNAEVKVGVQLYIYSPFERY
jgi:hypothetical protein